MSVDISDLNTEFVDDEPITITLEDSPAPQQQQDKSKNNEQKIDNSPADTNKQKVEDDTIKVTLNDTPTLGAETNGEEDKVSTGKDDYGWKDVVKFAVDKGVFTDIKPEELDVLENSLEAFQDVLQNELAQGIEVAKQQWLQGIVNPQTQQLIQHLEAGGKVSDFQQVYASDYTSVKEETVLSAKDTMRNTVRDFYRKTTAWDDNKINKLIQRHEDLDELKDEAKSALVGLRNIEKQEREQLALQTQQQRIAQEQQEKQRVVFINNEINSLKEFAGIPINKKVRDQVISNVYEDRTFNKINSDLDKYRVRLAVLDSLGILDNDTTLTAKAIDNATKKVKKEIENYDFKRSTVSNKRQGKGDEDKAIKSLINQIDNNSQFDLFK
jgi:hypothetical protein